MTEASNIIPFSLPLVTEVELVYRNKTKASLRPSIRTSTDAYNLFLRAWDMDKIELQEHFKILLLDRSNRCMGISTLATGGITQCVVDLRLAFATAIKASACNIILAHNHPSGNTKPSEADKTLTERFTLAGKILDLKVLDHIIVTKENYLSMADEGLMEFLPF